MEVCQSVLFIWHLVCKLADLLVCDQGGGALLDSDLDQGAGEEANSPAGGARGVGGSFNFQKTLWWWQLEPVLGGWFCRVGRHPPPDDGRCGESSRKVKVKTQGFSAWVEIFCRKIYLCLCPIVSVLDKDSIELKVHTHVLKKPKQAFECSEDKSSSWWGRENVLLMGGNNLAGQIVVATVHRGDRG